MKKAHIISHSHWDREWYLPYERHHMLLVEFMDTLIDTLQNDNEYKSFHLDGQTIILEDYLQVRPEKKEILTKLIKQGRIVIGPWYVLQDEFLTSSEANVRNLQIGHRDAEEYGEVCKVGYFPDSFGNMGQAPQMLKQAGMDTVVFGRGVKPTGFDNQVGESDSFESPYSEMYWQSNDGSKVMAVLFANWYSNGNEVPVEDEEAKEFWDNKLASAGKYASTEHLLFMNGCDHQPVQTDLSQAIRKAKELYPDIDFIHSNFNDYMDEIEANKPDDLAVIEGELRSQKTDGWYTLANCASARIYLKQMNARCQMLFEKVAEPIATMAHKLGMEYPHHLFTYGWKTLMQNHPHDSICGCSVDDVHREMVTRFEKAENVALHIIDECKDYISQHMDTENFTEDAKPFIVVNTTGSTKSGIVTVEVDVYKKYFREGQLRDVINEVRDFKLPALKVVDSKGNEMPASIKSLGMQFNYDLPKDKFRQPFVAQKVKVELEVTDIPEFSVHTFALIQDETREKKESLLTSANVMENEYIKAVVEDNGSITVTHKQSGHTFEGLCIYEDHGDIGNEYIYFQPVGEKAITTNNDVAEIKVIKDEEFVAAIQVKNTMMVPKRADDLLVDEINEIVEFKNRKAQRVDDMIPLELVTTYTLTKNAQDIKVKTTIKNNAIDHRVRALFATDIDTPYHYADSIFEVAKRDTVPSSEWENPCNAQHQQAFINVHDDNIGLTIGNKGLNEYEVLRDGHNTIAVTLHRGVRELGDWGVFMTPEAQCLGDLEVEFAIIPHGAGSSLYQSYEKAYQFAVPFTAFQTGVHTGDIKDGYSLLSVEASNATFSSLKVCEKSGDVMARWYNLSDDSTSLKVDTDMNVYTSNILEEKKEVLDSKEVAIQRAEILTLGFES